MESLDNMLLESDRKEFASVGSRIGASLLDLLILSPITIGLNFYNILSIKSLPLALIILTLGVFYKPLLEYFKGSTFGKMIVGISVTDTSYNGMSLDQSFLRSLPFFASSVILAPMTIAMFSSEELANVSSFTDYLTFSQVFAADYAYAQYLNWATSLFFIGTIIAMFANKNKMGLHDMMAKTYVVKN